jgi:hypothetical protein
MRPRAALALLLPLIALSAGPAAASRTTSRVELPPSTRVPVPELRLNELDYDQPGLDTGEFVEIVNVGSERSRLRHVALVFVNGTTSAEYRRVPLSGRLGPLRRLVVATSSVSVDGSARVIPLPLSRDNIQNGAPDGVALVDTANDVVLDALAYEGSIDQAAIEGMPGTFSLVSGHPVRESDNNEVAASICRLPDHADGGDDDSDWSGCAPTPGSANTAAPPRANVSRGPRSSRTGRAPRRRGRR